MKRVFLLAAALSLATAGAGAGPPKQYINWAKSWSDAVAEAKALNMPIVVHRHGFYWNPCWSVHRSVLENATYAAFAAKHTVEMLVTEEMDRALQEKSPLIKTYEGQDPYGDVAEYLVHFPGVTLDQLRALSNSAAVNYIAPAKKIPYTAIVDPHTLKEMEGFTGIYRPDDLIGKIRKHAKTLVLKHGEGIDRKLWNRVTEHEVQVDMLLGQEKIVEAMAVYQSLSRETFRQPKAILNRVTAVQESILADAKERLAAMEKEAATQKTATLKRDAGRLARVLKDTPLEEQANALLEKLK